LSFPGASDKGAIMPYTTDTWYHTNKYNADAACEHCGAVVQHESWCITCNRTVAYAYEAVLDATKLSVEDGIILHGLGVAWTNNKATPCACTGSAK